MPRTSSDIFKAAPHLPVTYTARGARTIGDMFRRRARESAELPALWEKRSGQWQKTTWRGFYEASRRVLAGLQGLGLAPGERVAILGETRSAWGILDMGAQLGGFVSFGIYPKQTPEQVRYLLAHSEAKVAFVDSEAEARTIIAAAQDLPTLQAIVPWTDALFAALGGGGPDADRRLLPASSFGLDPSAAASLAPAPVADAQVERGLLAIDPSATATLVYTSGTTGPPKAAMLSHANVLALLGTQASFMDLYQDDLSLSFLPMAHVAERILAFYGRICTGFATAYASSTAAVLDEMQEVRPTVFGSVPRIFEKAYAKITSELEKKPPVVKKLFDWALRVSTERVRRELAGKPVPLAVKAQDALADRLVWRRVRDVFGGRVRLFMTGAAPIAVPILELFWAARMPVYECYGMTEATVATHINRPGAVRLGTVGKVVSPMECRLADDQEILLRGPWIFQGYFKDPEATAATIVDGWLHSGDIGTLDDDGYLRITDRKKHLIITAGGKNLAPANIEKALREESHFISQVHAHGDRRPYVTALIAPSPVETLELGVELGLVSKPELAARTAELLAHPTSRSAALEAAMAKVTGQPAFVRKLREAVARGNAKLAHVEQVRRFAILDRDFSQERGELTPTMKIRRKEVERAHQATLDRLYDDPSFGHEPA
ncbi:MAG: long-chain fatty acid--CoA ligase [Myxococcota bacterium]